jgi:mannose-6-phosphate isomerase-like protein (cupin superfamily)
MKTYVANIEADTLANTNFRKVVFTAQHCQVVLMSLKPGEDIGAEVHELDQFFRFERGEGKVVLDGADHAVTDGSAVVVPAGVNHNVINTGSADLKLYTIYAPPEHKDGTVHASKADALAAEEHFDGATSL